MSNLEPNKNYETLDEDLEFRLKENFESMNANTPDGTSIAVLVTKPAPNNRISVFFMSNLPRQEMLRILSSYLESELAKNKQPPTDTVSGNPDGTTII